MAQVNLPATLAAAYWDKQKAALAKLAKPPATRLPEELKALTKLHLALDWDAFNPDKLKTADEVKARGSDLEDAVKGKIKTLLAQVDAVDSAAAAFDKEAKKDKAFPKEPLAAIAAIQKAAKEYTGDVEAAIDGARKAIAAKTKAVASAAGASNPLLVKQTKLVKSRLLTAIATLRKPMPAQRAAP